MRWSGVSTMLRSFRERRGMRGACPPAVTGLTAADSRWADIRASSFIYSGMALQIKGPEGDRLAREAAKVTGACLGPGVVQSFRERLGRVRRMRGPRLREELLKIG